MVDVVRFIFTAVEFKRTTEVLAVHTVLHFLVAHSLKLCRTIPTNMTVSLASTQSLVYFYGVHLEYSYRCNRLFQTVNNCLLYNGSKYCI